MKSFRLDRESVADFLESWPVIVAAAGIALGLGYLGWFDSAWRVGLVMFAGLYFGYVFRGSLTQKLRERYPHARFIGLLSVGMVVMTLGVLARMAFPETQGGWLDLAWLSVAFVSILAFLILNRRLKEVYE